MNTLAKYCADKFSVVAKFFRRPTAKAVAVEPDHAVRLDWFAPPSGPAKSPEEILRSWDVALGVDNAADDANDAANPTHH
jgi:hypothetical protein